MQFETVTAAAFGPFEDQTIALAPGMTLVFGPNEAGKSTWHAALYAGLCGMRRGKGGGRKEDREFEEHYRPWNLRGWAVGAVIKLADGRRVELRHELSGRALCSARDADLGRDYSAEIINDGAPDGSHWLGLDRRSFLSTACVRQADVLTVVNDAEMLQDYLQRAAATAATDATASAALERLRTFQAERVGINRANSTRPLRTAIERMEATRQRLLHAQERHTEYLGLAAELQEQEAARAKSAAQLLGARLREAEGRARVARLRLERARELTARNPSGPPPDLSQDDDLAQAASRAQGAWRPDGETAEHLRQRLNDLPLVPVADIEPSPDVIEAAERVRETSTALRLHDARRPLVDRSGEEAVTQGPAAGPAISARRIAMAACAAAVAGIAAFAIGQSLVGLVAIVLAGALAVWFVIQRQGQLDHDQAVERLRRQDLEQWQAQGAALLADRQAAEHQLRAALNQRQAAIGHDLLEAVREYGESCRSRAAEAALAAQRPALEHVLAEREAAESELQRAAARCGVTAQDDVGRVAGLGLWQAHRKETLRVAEIARREWAELIALLDGATIEGLQEAADAADRRVEELGGADEPPLGPAVLQHVNPDQLELVVQRATEQVERTRGRIQQEAASLPSVSEAEECLAGAEAERDRLLALDDILTRTSKFLEQAQERAHRDIAPVLAGSIHRWLQTVTGGRYIEARVDPGSLVVEVRGAGTEWRRVSLLSEGTAEQIYLLLRVAMAQHLVKPDEISPLLLDDITVQCDDRRELALLETLHQLSGERQIVLFSQERTVLDWARVHLSGPLDCIVELDPSRVPA